MQECFGGKMKNKYIGRENGEKKKNVWKRHINNMQQHIKYLGKNDNRDSSNNNYIFQV